jgi:hypothetical protein
MLAAKNGKKSFLKSTPDRGVPQDDRGPAGHPRGGEGGAEGVPEVRQDAARARVHHPRQGPPGFVWL